MSNKFVLNSNYVYPLFQGKTKEERDAVLADNPFLNESDTSDSD